MIIGENAIIELRVSFLDIDNVREIIFTCQANEKIKKTYPSSAVEYENGRFFVGINQEDTLILARRTKVNVSVEAQVNFKSGAVKKTSIDTITLSPTLNTEILEGNTPTRNIAALDLHFEGGILVTGNSVEVTDEQIRKALPNVVTTNDLDELVSDFMEEHPEYAGQPGAPGKDGNDGKSPYDLAVENGFEGTETEWLESLKGTPGKDGDNGKSAFQTAVENGYEGTEAELGQALAQISSETMTKGEMLAILNNEAGGEEP